MKVELELHEAHCVCKCIRELKREIPNLCDYVQQSVRDCMERLEFIEDTLQRAVKLKEEK